MAKIFAIPDYIICIRNAFGFGMDIRFRRGDKVHGTYYKRVY